MVQLLGLLLLVLAGALAIHLVGGLGVFGHARGLSHDHHSLWPLAQLRAVRVTRVALQLPGGLRHLSALMLVEAAAVGANRVLVRLVAHVCHFEAWSSLAANIAAGVVVSTRVGGVCPVHRAVSRRQVHVPAALLPLDVLVDTLYV